jgi:hypothetical protein
MFLPVNFFLGFDMPQLFGKFVKLKKNLIFIVLISAAVFNGGCISPPPLKTNPASPSPAGTHLNPGISRLSM